MYLNLLSGAINFVAVCESFNVAGSVVSAAIAADNLVIAIYFAFLFYLGKPGESEIASQSMELSASDQTPTDPENVTDDEKKSSSMSMMSVATSITVSSCIVALSKVLSKFILPSGISVSLPTLFDASFMLIELNDTSSEIESFATFTYSYCFSCNHVTPSVVASAYFCHHGVRSHSFHFFFREAANKWNGSWGLFHAIILCSFWCGRIHCFSS